jgi:MinD superfamily P-loop ATPase
MKAAYLTNKFDLNKEMTEELERWAAEEGVEPLGRVPYDDSVVNSMAAGKTIIEGPATPAGYSITKTYERLARLLDDGK